MSWSFFTLPAPVSAGTPAITYSVGGQTVATNSVAYAYDHDFRGSLWSVNNTTSTTAYTHDGFGRITGSAQTTPANATSSFNFTYCYSLTDALTSITYPSGRQVNYALGAGDLVTAVQYVASASGGCAAATGGTNYASSIGYTAAGGLSSMTLGNSNTLAQSYT